jgi:hypothetical protein
MPPRRHVPLLTYALLCFCVVLGLAAFAYVVRQTIAYVLHPDAFGGTHLSDAVLSRADLGGGILCGWLLVLLGAALAIRLLPPRTRWPRLLLVGTLLALGGIIGVLYCLQGWAQISRANLGDDGFGAIVIIPWIAVSYLSVVILLAAGLFIAPAVFGRRGHPADVWRPRPLPR